MGAKTLLNSAPVTVLLPAFTRGRQPVKSFSFGQNLSLVQREEVDEILSMMRTSDLLSPRQVSRFQRWDVFLRAESDRSWEFETEEQYDKEAMVCEMWLRELRLAIDIAGGGSDMENIEPGSGSRPMLVVPSDPRWASTVVHFGDVHGPGVWDREQLWTDDVLRLASRLVKPMFFRRVHGRVVHALGLRRAMLRLGLLDLPTRYGLAVTALESFFVAPEERHYIWDPPVRDRLQQAIGVDENTGLEALDEIRRLRNDVQHRGGRTNAGSRIEWDPVRASRPDRLLCRSLRWSIESADRAALLIDSGFKDVIGDQNVRTSASMPE